MNKIHILLLSVSACIMLQAMKESDKKTSAVEYWRSNGYSIKVDEHSQSFYKEAHCERTLVCDFCNEPGAATLWYGERTCAHDACLQPFMPYEEKFDEEAKTYNLSRGQAAFALAHARTWASVHQAYRPSADTLASYARKNPDALERAFATQAVFWLSFVHDHHHAPHLIQYTHLQKDEKLSPEAKEKEKEKQSFDLTTKAKKKDKKDKTKKEKKNKKSSSAEENKETLEAKPAS